METMVHSLIMGNAGLISSTVWIASGLLAALQGWGPSAKLQAYRLARARAGGLGKSGLR